jgi:hypothetical protein
MVGEEGQGVRAGRLRDEGFANQQLTTNSFSIEIPDNSCSFVAEWPRNEVFAAFFSHFAVLIAQRLPPMSCIP